MGEELQTSQVLSFEDARRVVEEHAAKLHPAGVEESDLLSSIGRVVAEPVHADRDFPPFNRAARDGYAVRSADVARVPQKLNLIGEIKAGAAELPGPVASGQAVAIMTGAPAPAGADAVVMVEYTSSNGSRP